MDKLNIHEWIPQYKTRDIERLVANYSTGKRYKAEQANIDRIVTRIIIDGICGQ